MSTLLNLPIVSRVSEHLAMSRSGRVALHLACMLSGSDLQMHWEGIERELVGH